MPTRHLEHVARIRLDSDRRLAILTTTLMLVPGVVWAYVDVSVVTDPAKLRTLFALRVLVLTLWLAGVWMIRRATSREQLRRVLFTLALLIVVFVGGVARLRPPTDFMPVRTLVLVSIGTFVVYPYQLRHQLAAWVALLLTSVWLVWGHYESMSGVERYSVMVNLLIAGVLGMAVAANRNKLDRDLDEALVREREAIETRERALAELRTLEGIIPICAYCHQVRTEAGAWEQLDQYVRSHSEADFSHGMCPNCAREHFPEIMEPTSDPHEGPQHSSAGR